MIRFTGAYTLVCLAEYSGQGNHCGDRCSPGFGFKCKYSLRAFGGNRRELQKISRNDELVYSKFKKTGKARNVGPHLPGSRQMAYCFCEEALQLIQACQKPFHPTLTLGVVSTDTIS